MKLCIQEGKIHQSLKPSKFEPNMCLATEIEESYYKHIERENSRSDQVLRECNCSKQTGWSLI